MTFHDATILGYVLIGCATMALLVAGRLGVVARPGEVLDVLLSRRTVRLLIVLAWIWLGWHFLVRTG
jgi:Family of unknown function (DUF6186)